MAAHSSGGHVAERAGAAVNGLDFRDIDAEFVIAQSGCDIGMGCGIDIRIDANGELGAYSHASRKRIDQSEFRLRLAIETVNSVTERVLDFGGRFSNAGKDHLLRIASRLQNAEQLA